MNARDHGPPDRRAAGRPGGRAGRCRPAGSRRAVRLGGILACGLRRQPIRRCAPPRAADAGPAGDRHQPRDRPGPGGGAGSRAGLAPADPRHRRGGGRRRAGPAGPGPGRGPRGGRGRRGRGPRPAGPAVCRDPRGAQPDDRRPDAAPRGPPPRRAASGSRPSTPSWRCSRAMPRGWSGWPAPTWRPAPPTSATSRGGSSAS